MGALLLSSGCADWPNFDYAPLPDVFVNEQESGGSTAQNLGTLRARTIVSGNITDTGLQDAEAFAVFGLEYWYSGDLDYYAFTMADPGSLLISLDWADNSADLDVLLFEYDDVEQTLSALLGKATSEGTMSETFGVASLEPETFYILVVAGRAGPGSPYTLVNEPIYEGVP